MSTAYTTISSANLPQDWPESYGSSGTLGIFCTVNFTSDDSKSWVAGTGNSLRSEFVTEAAITVAGNTGTYAAYSLPKTDTACTPNTVRYFAVIFDSKGGRRDVLYGDRHLRASLGDAISELQWAADNAQTYRPQLDTYPTTNQMNVAIAAALYAPSSTTQKGVSKSSTTPTDSANPVHIENTDPKVTAGQAANVASIRTLGTGATQAAAGNDSRFGASSTDYATLAAAVTAISGTPTTLTISSVFPAGGNVTVPKTLELRFIDAGAISITTGQALSILSDTFNWPLRQVFINALAGQGTVYLNDSNTAKTSRIHPEWWGIATDGATDDTAAFKAAEAARTIGSTLVLPLGISLLTDASVILDMTKPGIIEGYGQGTLLRFKTGTGTGVPLIRINPPAGGGELYSTRKNVFGYVVRNFDVDAAVPGQGGDVIQIYNSAATHSAYQSEISGITSLVTGGYDVRANNDNGAGAPNDTTGSIHLHIHDCGFTNGLYLKYASDSLKVVNNAFYNSTAGAGKRAIEAWFIAGAANITIRDNSLVMDGGVVFHNGININFLDNYCETANSVGSNGAYVDFMGDVSQIMGGRIAGNLFVRLNPSTLNGVRIHNAKNIDMKSMNYASGQSGSAAVVTTTTADSLYFNNQNVVGGGAGIIDGTNNAAKGVYYDPNVAVTFAGLPTVPRIGTILTVVDGTVGSNPLTGGGAGCKAIYQSGAWKSL